MRRAEGAAHHRRIRPQGQFQTGDRRRSGHHRVPVNDQTSRYRWFILAAFVLSTAINYLDRNTLAALAPNVQAEFGLNDTQYGLVYGTAFSIPYALIAPFAGLLIDRIGLTRAIALALALWSFASIATGLTRGLGSLIACRVMLGAAEA